MITRARESDSYLLERGMPLKPVIAISITASTPINQRSWKCCDYRTTATESGGEIKFTGAIDVPEINREIADVMEGGVEAFTGSEGPSMGIVFLRLLLVQFEPQPRFGVSILQEQQLARNDLVNAQAAIRVRQRAGVAECFTSWNLEAPYNAVLPPASGVKVSQPVRHRDCGA
jgi:hypothetical protein